MYKPSSAHAPAKTYVYSMTSYPTASKPATTEPAIMNKNRNEAASRYRIRASLAFFPFTLLAFSQLEVRATRMMMNVPAMMARMGAT